jgi:hypothetical protein
MLGACILTFFVKFSFLICWTIICSYMWAMVFFGALCMAAGRGLYSSTFRLNLSAFCGIGGTLRGCVGCVRVHQGVSRVCFVSEAAQVELKSGRV